MEGLWVVVGMVEKAGEIVGEGLQVWRDFLVYRYSNFERGREDRLPLELQLLRVYLIYKKETSRIADETIHEERRDIVERAATTGSSLEAEQDSGDKPTQTRFERLSKQSHEPPVLRVNTLGSGEDNMNLMELMAHCTKLFDRVLALENTNNVQDLKITHLKKRVKRLEKKRKSRTPHHKRRLFKVRIEPSVKKSLDDQEDASNQRRNDQDEEISFRYWKAVERKLKAMEKKQLVRREQKKNLIKKVLSGKKTSESSELAKEPRDKEADEVSQDELQQMMIIIIRVGNHAEVHHFFDDMLKGFNRDDLVMLWILVKEKFNTIEPTNDKEIEIWVELKRVHHVSTENGIDIYMLVEKEYPLSRGTLTLMLVAKLLVDQDNEMSRELLRKIFMRIVRFKRLLSAVEVTTANMEVTTTGYQDLFMMRRLWFLQAHDWESEAAH
nr:hypothetical protein [Tanacetum cinerariifolium]